jgi:hypothetical protein
VSTKAEILARLEGGEIGAAIERELMAALGWTPYQINGVTCGWTDPLTGMVRVVGKFALDEESCLLLLPPGWLWEVQQQGGEFRARVAASRLNQATWTALQPTRVRALVLAIARAR